MESALKSLRELSGTPIEKAAQIAGCSYGHLWNVEHDLATLDDEQLTKLQHYFFDEIATRLDRIESSRKGMEPTASGR